MRKEWDAYIYQFNELFITDLLVSFMFGLGGETGKDGVSVLHDSNGVFEVSNGFTRLFSEDGVGVEEIVVHGFLDTELGTLKKM